MARELHEKVGVFDVPQYLAYFSLLPLIDFWKSKGEWARRGSLLSYLRNALIALQDAEVEAKTQSKTILDLNLDNPIDPKTNLSLTSTWEKQYGYKLHPTQEATHQILGSVWRHLVTRQIRAEPVKGLHTLESTSGIEPSKRQWKVGDLRLIEENDAKGKEVSYRHNSNPFLFI